MKRLKIAVSVLCLLAICFTGMLPAFAAASGTADKNTATRYNVVMVIDNSGSLDKDETTDPNGMRFEAVSRFFALMSDKGNRVGVVSFSDKIHTRSMEDMSGVDSKNKAMSWMQGDHPYGDTDIGGALKAATDMLDNEKDPSLPSVIVLFTDGKTFLRTDDALEKSKEQKADAIEAARKGGYPVYSVCLNASGSADPEEIKQIANATSGKFIEVKTAEDLEGAFSKELYNLIFSTEMKESEKTFSAEGTIEGSFEIPTVGVEEVNIMLSGKTSDYTLTDPTGKTYSKSDLSAYTMSGVIKIVAPTAGEWHYLVKGQPGDKVQINIVYNTDLFAGISISPDKTMYMTNDQITVNGFLTESGKKITQDKYTGFSAKLSMTNGQGNTQTYDMTLGSDGFEVNIPLTSGTYTASVNIVGQEYDITSEEVVINVDNTPPTADKNIEQTVLLWPFVDNSETIDLTTAASDDQDSTLRYEIESTAFTDEDYTLEDGKLTMHSYSLNKGSFTIRAYDSDGAYCTFDVYVETVNMTLIGIIILVGGIVITLAIIGIGLWLALNKRFMGACYVTQFDAEGNYYEEVKREKGRGRIALSSFNLKNPGFNTSKCYLQATGKDHVYLVMGQKVYGDGKLDKKFRIDGSGFEVTISTDEFQQSGIRVKFVSRLNNTTYSF